MIRTSAACAVLAASLALAQPAFSPPTGFTYQGVLEQNGSPYTGPGVLYARLYDQLSGGSPITEEILVPVTVEAGLVSAEFDFGPDALGGGPAFVQLRFQADGAALPTLLSPRQRLTPAPRSVQANGARVMSDGSVVFRTAPGAGGLIVSQVTEDQLVEDGLEGTDVFTTFIPSESGLFGGAEVIGFAVTQIAGATFRLVEGSSPASSLRESGPIGPEADGRTWIYSGDGTTQLEAGVTYTIEIDLPAGQLVEWNYGDDGNPATGSGLGPGFDVLHTVRLAGPGEPVVRLAPNGTLESDADAVFGGNVAGNLGLFSELDVGFGGVVSAGPVSSISGGVFDRLDVGLNGAVFESVLVGNLGARLNDNLSVLADTGLGTASPLARLHVSNFDLQTSAQEFQNDTAVLTDSRAGLSLNSFDPITPSSPSAFFETSGRISMRQFDSAGEETNDWSISRGRFTDNLTFRLTEGSTTLTSLTHTRDGRLGLDTPTPLAPLHLASGNLGVTEGVLLDADLLIEDEDGILSIFSGPGGTLGSAIRLAEKDPAFGGVEDSWSIARATSGANSELLILHTPGTTTPDTTDIELRLFTNGDAGLKGQLFQNSSASLKDDIAPIADAVETLCRLRGVSYTWKRDGEHDIGFIAEEMAEVLPDIVQFEDGEPVGIDYGRVTALLVEAVKDQEARMDDFEQRLRKIEAGR